jgi:putative effector of murein hydrolase
VFDDNGGIVAFIKMWAAASAIYGYERVVAALLRRLKLTRMPSTLAAMLILFGALRVSQKTMGRATADKFSLLLKPGVDFLGKWMGLFLAPPLVSLDASIRALPAYPSGVWANTAGFMSLAWALTHAASGAVASRLAPKREKLGSVESNGMKVAVAQAAAPQKVSQDEAVRRAWIVIGSASYLGAAAIGGKTFGRLCQISTTIGSFSLAKILPSSLQRIFHPIVVCAVTTNLGCRFVGTDLVPYFDNGNGVGDMFFKWLAAAVTGLGVRMYDTTPKWLDDADDFKCVLTTCAASGCFSIMLTSAAAVYTQSPLSIPYPLSLPLINRSVMSALGIEGSMAIGPECDPKLSVAGILITGCIGASLGKSLLELCPAVFNTSSPVVRGIAMGCSAHSIGTAGLISEGDNEAAAISGASMCLAGTAHTIFLNLPTIVPLIRAFAGLPVA